MVLRKRWQRCGSHLQERQDIQHPLAHHSSATGLHPGSRRDSFSLAQPGCLYVFTGSRSAHSANSTPRAFQPVKAVSCLFSNPVHRLIQARKQDTSTDMPGRISPGTAPRPGAAVNWRNWVNLAVGAMLPKGRWQCHCKGYTTTDGGIFHVFQDSKNQRDHSPDGGVARESGIGIQFRQHDESIQVDGRRR